MAESRPSRRECTAGSSSEQSSGGRGLLGNVWTQDVACEQETPLDQGVGRFEAPILVLDDAVAVIADAVEVAEDLGPRRVAQAGQARDLPADARRHGAALIQTVAVDLNVLGLEMEYVVAELADEAALVDHQPDQVRRVVVEPDRAAPLLDDAAPD